MIAHQNKNSNPLYPLKEKKPVTEIEGFAPFMEDNERKPGKLYVSSLPGVGLAEIVFKQHPACLFQFSDYSSTMCCVTPLCFCFSALPVRYRSS